MSKICFITAIYGGYEKSCKKFVKQTIDTDFICFTDNNDIINNGWIIDTTPYHLNNKSHLDTNNLTNSLSNNKHTFNISKYYKQSFSNIPILNKYDVIVWLDGTIEIIYDKTTCIPYWEVNQIKLKQNKKVDYLFVEDKINDIKIENKLDKKKIFNY